MILRNALVLAAGCLAHQADAQHQQFYRWSSPANDLMRRQAQGPLPGYHPEFGTCGSGTTCENACGANWQSCKASTDLSLFCYNKVDLGQTCCENGSGRACDRGFYCAWNEIGGRVWCCKEGQNLKECGVPPPTTTTTPTPTTIPDATTVTVTTTTTTTDVEDGTITRTVTEPTDCPNCCPSVYLTETVTETATSVITSVETVTVFTSVPPDVSTITVYSTVSVTVSVGDECCDPDCNPTSKPHHWPTKPGYPSKPGHHGSTSYPPGYSEPIRRISHSGNETTSGPTSTPALVTGGAGTLDAGRLAMVVVVVVMLLL